MSLAGGAKHGHALLKDIEAFAGVKLGPGALYGAITRLEERGLIEPLESDDRRRPYQITASGSQALADAVAQMRELVAGRTGPAQDRPDSATEAGLMRSGEPGTDDAPSSITHTANDPRLRWYPPSWRARYGDELVALLDEEYGGTVPVKVRLSLVTGGLRQRARQSGLAGDTAPATDGVRAGALVVLAAWAAFVIAGASFAKFAEHFDEALPHRSGAHRVPDLAFTRAPDGGWGRERPGGRGSLLALPAFVRFLRAGGWASVRRHFMRALVCTALVGAVTLPLLLWAHHLTPHQRNGGLHWYGALFLLWAALIFVSLALWTMAAIATARRVEFSPAVLTAEAALAAAIAVAMVVMVGATAVWWGAMANDAPAFLSASPGGAAGSPWDLWFVATVGLMLVAVGAAAFGVVRELRVWTTMRSD